MRACFLPAAVLAGLLATPALAQEAAVRPLCDAVYATVSVTSDYRYEGLSSSNRSPTGQALAHCWRQDGWYAGTLITGIDYLDTPRTRVEIDVYAGRRFRRGSWELNLNLLYSTFKPGRPNGSGYDLIEPVVEVVRHAGRATWTGRAALAFNDRTGRTWHLGGSVAYRMTPWLTANGRVGALYSDRGMDRRFGEIGLAATWRRWTLEARYVATDRSRAQCYGLNWCDAGVTAAVTYRVSP